MTMHKSVFRCIGKYKYADVFQKILKYDKIRPMVFNILKYVKVVVFFRTCICFIDSHKAHGPPLGQAILYIIPVDVLALY